MKCVLAERGMKESLDSESKVCSCCHSFECKAVNLPDIASRSSRIGSG